MFAMYSPISSIVLDDTVLTIWVHVCFAARATVLLQLPDERLIKHQQGASKTGAGTVQNN